MLDPADLAELDTLSGEQAKQYARQLIENLGTQLTSAQATLKFEQAKNQALNLAACRA